MNKVILMGRLVRDPEVRYTKTGKVVTQFTIAVDRRYKNADGTRDADFISCIIWGKRAENLGNTVFKGQRILVEGELQIRSYNNKEGAKRYATEIICHNYEYIEKKAETGPMDAFGEGHGEELELPPPDDIPDLEEIPY